MRSRAMQILDSEEIKLRRTMEETQVIRTNLHDFRQHAQIAIRNGCVKNSTLHPGKTESCLWLGHV